MCVVIIYIHNNLQFNDVGCGVYKPTFMKIPVSTVTSHFLVFIFQLRKSWGAEGFIKSWADYYGSGLRIGDQGRGAENKMTENNDKSGKMETI